MHELCSELTVNAGGSYSGVYVPLLGEAIVNGNDNGSTPTINLEVSPAPYKRLLEYGVWNTAACCNQ